MNTYKRTEKKKQQINDIKTETIHKIINSNCLCTECLSNNLSYPSIKLSISLELKENHDTVFARGWVAFVNVYIAVFPGISHLTLTLVAIYLILACPFNIKKKKIVLRATCNVKAIWNLKKLIQVSPIFSPRFYGTSRSAGSWVEQRFIAEPLSSSRFQDFSRCTKSG